MITLKKIEYFGERHSPRVCITLGILTGVLYYLQVCVDVKQTISGVITVNSILLVLLVSLQESPTFEKLRVTFPAFQKILYSRLKSQMQYGFLFVALSIVITMFPEPSGSFLYALVMSIYFTFFWLMTLESFYTVRLAADLIIKNFNAPK